MKLCSMKLCVTKHATVGMMGLFTFNLRSEDMLERLLKQVFIQVRAGVRVRDGLGMVLGLGLV